MGALGCCIKYLIIPLATIPPVPPLTCFLPSLSYPHSVPTSCAVVSAPLLIPPPLSVSVPDNGSALLPMLPLPVQSCQRLLVAPLYTALGQPPWLATPSAREALDKLALVGADIDSTSKACFITYTLLNFSSKSSTAGNHCASWVE